MKQLSGEQQIAAEAAAVAALLAEDPEIDRLLSDLANDPEIDALLEALNNNPEIDQLVDEILADCAGCNENHMDLDGLELPCLLNL